MNLPTIRCNSSCKGCTVLPLTRDQFQARLEKLMMSNSPRDREIVGMILNMDAFYVWCIQRQQECLFEIK